MKLATLKDGSRDGALVLVSRDLARYTPADDIAGNLQTALDNWSDVVAPLTQRAQQLEDKAVPSNNFDQKAVHSPLPRSYQWADGSAYINHVELVRKARGAEVPESFYSDPLMYQGGSDGFLDPRSPIPLGDPAWGCDMEGEIAVITDDVPMGVSSDVAAGHIRLIMLCNDVSLRGLIPGELAKGFGFFQSKPPSAFSPVAVTPDELGDAWRGGLLHGTLAVDLNGKPFGRTNSHEDATFTLPQLVAHAARTRPLAAGTIIGSGTVSNKGEDGGPGKAVADGGRGYSCIAEVRMIETIQSGQAATPFMRDGDVVRIDMRDENDASIFGEIEQSVKATA